MVQLLPVAELCGHHPDVHVVNYGEVIVESTSHDVGGLSLNDFVLADRINKTLGVPTK
jgi:4a-hydroxytetrahydrobiopterin dehydratase